MKLQIPRSWIQKMARAELETGAAIEAGTLDKKFLLDPAAENVEREQDNVCEMRAAFGRLIELERRKRGLSIAAFASQHGLDPDELRDIECKALYIPEPSTVFQLASILKVPQAPLMQLAGLTEARDAEFVHEAVRFAANSKGTAKLSREERVALETFVAELSKRR
jgi:ribosome-binding protein aMBF1 (putative translation factor)